jgi:hypothetical protein
MKKPPWISQKRSLKAKVKMTHSDDEEASEAGTINSMKP